MVKFLPFENFRTKSCVKECLWGQLVYIIHLVPMHRSAKSQTPPNVVDLLLSCEGVFLLCFLGHIVTWQCNPNLLDYNWPCTVINDHDWQLRKGPLMIYLVCARMWDLENEENYILHLDNHSGYDPNEHITCLAYSSTKGETWSIIALNVTCPICFAYFNRKV